MSKIIKKYYCLDCNKPLSNYRAKRCYSCSSKEKHRIGVINHKEENHPRWKGGKPKCINCGKQVSNYKNKRCYTCSKYPKNHPMWKGGITTKTYYCIDCKTKVSYCSVKYGNGRCKVCAGKERKGCNYGQFGKDNANYKHGRTFNNKCHKCNKLLKDHRSKICKECWYTSIKGKANPFYGKKHTEETRKKVSLANGGTGIPYENSDYPYIFKKIAPKIRQRDNYICQLCGEYGKSVHHIDYNKENCKENNLITLCNKCNCKVNYNRTYWTEYFNEKIKELIPC